MSPATKHESVIWHDVENGSYSADLPLWRELASESAGRVLEVGCGTGRVALDLGRAGHTVLGVDNEPALLDALTERASEAGLPVRGELADARELAVDGSFGLIAAPMQTIQLLEDADARVSALRAARRRLAEGGTVALAIIEDVVSTSMSVASGFNQPLPDVAEVDGRVYSSLPLEVAVADGHVVVARLRQTVARDGELAEARQELRMCELSAEQLEREALEAGLRPAGRRQIAATDAHIGSTVVLLERERWAT